MVFNTILGFADQTFTVLILVVTAGLFKKSTIIKKHNDLKFNPIVKVYLFR